MSNVSPVASPNGQFFSPKETILRHTKHSYRMWLMLCSGVDSVITNAFNFDLLLFIKQVGNQNIARVIVKQSICFDSIEKKERYYPVEIHLSMPERHWFTAEAFTALHTQHTPQKLFTRTSNICQTDLRNSECFFLKQLFHIHAPTKGWGGRWLWTISASRLCSSLLISDQF